MEAVNAVVVAINEIPTIEAVLHRQMLAGNDDDLPQELSIEGLRSVEDIAEDLRSATDALQQEIVAAISSYEKRKRTELVRPHWAPRHPADLDTAPSDLVGRTLADANLIKARWQEWLDTEMQRVRRSRHPRTGDSPYVMPAELSMPTIRSLPPTLGSGDLVVPTQPVVDLAVGE